MNDIAIIYVIQYIEGRRQEGRPGGLGERAREGSVPTVNGTRCTSKGFGAHRERAWCTLTGLGAKGPGAR